MQVTLETTSGLERRMRISVPSEMLENQVNAKLKETAGKVQLKGFRPGKVPMREVKRRFGEGIRQEVSSEIMQNSFAEAVRTEAVSPAGMPQIEDVSLEAGKDLEFTAVFEVFPEVPALNFSNITIERPVSEVTPVDVEKMIDTLRDQGAEFKEVERPCVEGDQVNMDYEGLVDGEVFDGGTAEGEDLVLGAGKMVPGFETGIEGAAKNETREINVTFPEEYQSEELAGKAAVFKIKVNSISESVKPELNDEFFEKFGVKEGGIDAFRTEVTSNMRKELQSVVKNKVKSQIMDGLVAENILDLPKSLISQEIDRLRNEAVQQFGGANIDPSMLPAEMFTAQAEKRVSLGLLLSAIIEQHELKVDDDKVKEMIENLASSYDEPEQVINYYYGNEQQLVQVQNLVLEDQVVDTILAAANVEDITQGYDDAIKPLPQPLPEVEDTTEDTIEDGDASADPVPGEGESS
ncbi:MAG: trigger factor [Pseudomonadales bacterium]|nr:trigger factor [Pseudomonadales bacterium]